MAHPHAHLIEHFYTAFQKLDGATMAACYNPDAVFTDPAFGTLHGTEIGAMWQMLAQRAEDFSLTFSKVEADDVQGSAEWIAIYRFSQTGRRVENRVKARFTFKEGRFATHVDQFDLYRWARQALGLKGILLGWAPPVQGAINKQARANLAKYQERQRA